MGFNLEDYIKIPTDFTVKIFDQTNENFFRVGDKIAFKYHEFDEEKMCPILSELTNSII